MPDEAMYRGRQAKKACLFNDFIITQTLYAKLVVVRQDSHNII